MFNTLTLAENARGSLAVTVLGTLALFAPEAGLPGGTATPTPHRHWDCSLGTVLDLWLFLSQMLLLGESSWSCPVRAGISWRGFCLWCYRSQLVSLPGNRAAAGDRAPLRAAALPCPQGLPCTACPISSSAFVTAALPSGQAITPTNPVPGRSCLSWWLSGPIFGSCLHGFPSAWWSGEPQWAVSVVCQPLCCWLCWRYISAGCALNMTGYVARLGKCLLAGVVWQRWLFGFLSLN